MLSRLFIKNFALIESLELELHHGFNVVTGETGAGKSIIIDAVDVAIGGTGLTEFIRSGEEKALVEAVFETEDNSKVSELLEQYGFLPEPGESLIMSRELVKTGKNLCRINGRAVNLSLYREFARNLVDIYGQHHQQSLLDPQRHIGLLDEYGGPGLTGLKHKLSLVHEEMNSLRRHLNSLLEGEKEKARTADLYRYQVEEIEKSQLRPDEEQALEEEKHLLSYAGKLSLLTNSVYELLYEGGRHKPAADLIHEATNFCKEAAAIDEKLLDSCEAIESSLYQIIETARDIKSYAEKIESDPDRLVEVENRLDQIRQLKKKYGETVQDILDYKDKIAVSLAVLDNYDEEREKSRAKLADAESEYNDIARRLSAERKKTAQELKKKITAELKYLNMPHVTFEVQFLSKKQPGALGTDDIEFLISPNKGEPLKPLAKIVSGGEVSRIMLAFKTILAKLDSVATLIFDEVDAGVGGQALHAVAQKLSFIGLDRQVICVTHSPQIAGCGDYHYSVRKMVDNGRTLTRVQLLSPEERVDEIARMLSGGQVTPVTQKHAEEILQKKLF